MSCFPESTEKDRFDQLFLFTLNYRGQTCNTIDELVKIIKQDREKFYISKPKITPKISDEFDMVFEKFGYVTAQIGSKRMNNFEFLGFKLDSEPFIRVGPPHLEESREQVCFGNVKGYRLYESSEKKYHLLSHRDL